ncbi:hypothetical protein [Rhizobium terrae]|uniref:hypothetical protein n=1 Tax=Rhizobium terrae TaxID=2171756 RepID=UPI000E3EA301|nr:hypothetical protein [Rhizobium terrae]
MTTMDKVTEEIAHFIGLFHTTVEETRLRDAYTDFFYYAAKEHIVATPFVPSTFHAPYEFVGFDPDVPYKAPVYTTPLWHPSFSGHYSHPPIPVVESEFVFVSIELPEDTLPGFRSGHSFAVKHMEPPGSVANYIVQAASLSDDDQFNVGGSKLIFNPKPIDDADILETAEEALARPPIGKPEIPGSSAEIIDVINTVISQLETLTVAPLDTTAKTFAHQAKVVEGTYVNGESAAEAPVLKDYFSFQDEEDVAEDGSAADAKAEDPEDDAAGDEDDGPSTNAVVMPDGSIAVENSVDLVAGSNTAVNEAVVKNVWVGAKVTAVVGDHVEVNAIVQTNVIQDNDSIASAVSGWTSDDGPDEVFNIAGFQRADPLADSPDAHSAHGGFPSAWAIAEIHGDLMITSWLEQYVFMSDNDIGILSSSGATTQVIAGDNASINHTSILELAMQYDLIIVGGSIYDASIIHQTNVLFDDDVVGAVSNFETSGTGSISSSGNLLWNQALIYNVGGAARFEALPSAYLDTANDLAAGGDHLSAGVLGDTAFSGLGGLRVLYISGDLLNIQYISQTTIMGDSDQIALAMNAVYPVADATWSVSTGGNALINNAAILDLDSLGHTYVGGEQYSQETLFQAELISHQPELLGRDPNALVNEAVLFLDDAMLEDGAPPTGIYVSTDDDGHYQNDGLQHVLG